MKHVFAISLLLVGGFAAVWSGQAGSDLERMQGRWRVDSLFEEGQLVPQDELDILECTVKDDVFTVAEKGTTVAQYQIKVDPAKTPKSIDFTHLIGADKGKTEPAIYVLDKDQIKICLDEQKKVRPTSFESKANLSVITLRRKTSP